MYIKEIKKENKPILKKDFLISYFSKGCPATFDKDTGLQNCETGKSIVSLSWVCLSVAVVIVPP